MNLSRILYLFFFLELSYCDRVKSKYIQFSNQIDPPLREATNFATLKSGDFGKFSYDRFTICGSIYIGFYRSYQTFYTVRRNRLQTLWFSLSIYNQDTTEEVYTSGFYYFDNVIYSNTGCKVTLRPHAWSHACTTVDVKSGHVIVVINGILTHNATISSTDFTYRGPTVFKNRLVLGVNQKKFPGQLNENWQSEASATNVNVFSVAMNPSQLVEVTTTGRWTDGDVVDWSEAEWTLSGSAEELIYKQPTFPNLIKMGDGFESAHDCMNLCPKIQAGGRLPLTPTASDAEQLAQMFYQPDSKDSFWAPFVYQTEGNFIDHYTEVAMPSDLWLTGQPNGGLIQSCTLWEENDSKGSLWDVTCVWTYKVKCLCQFIHSPILRIRGLCKDGKIDTHYTLKSLNDSVVFMGLTGTVIKFLPTTSEWRLDIITENTRGLTSAEETSFIMGRHDWSIDGDSAKCSKGNKELFENAPPYMIIRPYLKEGLYISSGQISKLPVKLTCIHVQL